MSLLDPLMLITLQNAGVDLPRRRKHNYVGFTVEDDESGDTTTITNPGGGGGGGPSSPQWVDGRAYFGTGGEWIDQGRLYNIAEQAVESGAMFHVLSLPDGVTLTQIEVWLKAAGGHGALPTLPYARLYRGQPNDTSTYTVLGTADDASANVTAYQAHHAMILLGLSEVIDNGTYRYLIELFGEEGGDFVAGLQYLGTKATFTS